MDNLDINHVYISLFYSELVELKSSHGYVAAVMTQTTDVEAELNGMLTYDRAAFKCDPNELAKLNRKLYR